MNPSENFRVLILGASGQFGKRLCRRLGGEKNLMLLLGGRDLTKLAKLQRDLRNLLGINTEIVPCDIWRDDLSALLVVQQPHVVVHLAGPFQNQDYKIAQACLCAGVPYIDMADGRAFVENFHSLDIAAKEKNIALITGASTVPALSSTILDKICQDMPEVRTVDYGISAGLKTGLGSATLKAVLSYCGKPYATIGKSDVTVYGLDNPRRHNFSMPVGKRSIVNCDIPDHGLFPARYPGLTSLRFASCIDAPGLACLLSVMSQMVQRKWVKNWNFLSPLIYPFMNAVKSIGSPHSGFFMNCTEAHEGANRQVLFEVIARDSCGLEIPVTPVVILIKRMMKGEKFPAGAYPCLGLFSLNAFTQELANFPISFNWKTAS